MRGLLLVVPLLVSVSACANSCGSEEKKTDTTQSASTSAEAGAGHGGGASRFAKPFVPGAPTALPPRDE